jgi:hypothetical protein
MAGAIVVVLCVGDLLLMEDVVDVTTILVALVEESGRMCSLWNMHRGKKKRGLMSLLLVWLS